MSKKHRNGKNTANPIERLVKQLQMKFGINVLIVAAVIGILLLCFPGFTNVMIMLLLAAILYVLYTKNK